MNYYNVTLPENGKYEIVLNHAQGAPHRDAVQSGKRSLLDQELHNLSFGAPGPSAAVALPSSKTARIQTRGNAAQEAQEVWTLAPESGAGTHDEAMEKRNSLIALKDARQRNEVHPFCMPCTGCMLATNANLLTRVCRSA